MNAVVQENSVLSELFWPFRTPPPSTLRVEARIDRVIQTFIGRTANGNWKIDTYRSGQCECIWKEEDVQIHPNGFSPMTSTHSSYALPFHQICPSLFSLPHSWSHSWTFLAFSLRSRRKWLQQGILHYRKIQIPYKLTQSPTS